MGLKSETPYWKQVGILLKNQILNFVFGVFVLCQYWPIERTIKKHWSQHCGRKSVLRNYMPEVKHHAITWSHGIFFWFLHVKKHSICLYRLVRVRKAQPTRGTWACRGWGRDPLKSLYVTTLRRLEPVLVNVCRETTVAALDCQRSSVAEKDSDSVFICTRIFLDHYLFHFGKKVR